MTDIYLARHGKTEWNTELRMQGRLNSPLTQEGIDGAYRLRETIAEVIGLPSVLYSSPMPRALQTAFIAMGGPESPARCPIIPTDFLCEMDLGIWEGMRLEDAKKSYPEELDNFRNHPDRYVPVSGGETFHDTYARADAMLSKLDWGIAGSDNDAPVLLVSHMILIQSVLCAISGGDISTLRQTPFIEQTRLIHIHGEKGLTPTVHVF
ncbi:MAG: histidine phosphatase family protein [Saccharofermentans sp.]|jgi:probable phosphoglycerate mutase|nr:histidine phosphatase family protein [Mageeibacillus sp.]MCI1263933.1 histidine phosphatase family protein [Saccharofermentans sp.]MCI1275572.1 histidine phosphatase family protein [Saccharofermentans sp.]MCI1768874.1 histidine phosphatase family protein [Mageeibacillus sp.]MCI2044631.1 histidine phosphatase family protein [Mageeibacillus sp.]